MAKYYRKRYRKNYRKGRMNRRIYKRKLAKSTFKRVKNNIIKSIKSYLNPLRTIKLKELDNIEIEY